MKFKKKIAAVTTAVIMSINALTCWSTALSAANTGETSGTGNSYDNTSYQETDFDLFDGQLYYEKIDSDGDGIGDALRIIGCDASASYVSVPDYYNLLVKEIGANAFGGCSYLTSVSLPYSIEKIDNNAFEGCSNLQTLTIMNSNCEIAESFLSGCNSSITIKGDTGSTAWDYAYRNNINFIDLFEEKIGFITYEEIYSEDTGECEALRVKSCDISANEVIIYDVYNGLPVIEIGDGAFKDCAGLTYISLQPNTRKIGNSAFAGCTGLTSIYMPDLVEEIGSSAFAGCYNLSDVTIYNMNCEIADDAFSGANTALTIWGYGGSTAQAYAESHNINFMDFNQPYYEPLKYEDVNPDSTDGYKIVISCDATASAVFISDYVGTLPVREIGDGAFRDCVGLTCVDLSYSIEKIGDSAFEGCSNLQEITINNMNCEIADNALSGINTYLTIRGYNGSTAQTYAKNHNINFISLDYDPLKYDHINTDSTEAYKVVTSCDATAMDVHIYDTVDGLYVKEIGDGAFKDCSSLMSVYASSSVEKIGSNAFEGCDNLQTLTILNSNCEIAYNALPNPNTYLTIWGYGGSTAQTFAQNNGIHFMRLDAASNDEFLTYTEINAGSTDAYKIVKSCDTAATEVMIPDNHENLPVREIGEGAFAYCKDLTSIYIPDGIRYIANNAFEGCVGLTKVVLPYTVTEISANTFIGCENLNFIAIPQNITKIDSGAFDKCTNLQEITIYSPDCEIADDALPGYKGVIRGYENSTAQAYADKNNIAFINISAGDAQSDGSLYYEKFDIDGDGTEDAFRVIGCDKSATKIKIPGVFDNLNVLEIGSEAFADCENITSVFIPYGIRTIRKYAFKNCTSLKTVNIPETVEEIEFQAFYNCSSLEFADIPESVIRIDSQAFEKCTGMQEITFLNPNCYIADDVLAGYIGVIRGYKNSTAQEYAEKNNIEFIELNGSTPDGPITYVKIDLNGDGTEYALMVSRFDGSVTEVEIPSTFEGMSVVEIGSDVFFDCSNLTTVILPEGIRAIRKYAFKNCISLNSINIPETVEEIGYQAFYDCSSLEYIKLPESVVFVTNQAFAECTNMQEITILNPDCNIADDILSGYKGVIRGYENSTAQEYAEKNKIKFEAIDDPKQTEVTTAVTTDTTTTETTSAATTDTTATEATNVTTSATAATEATNAATSEVTTTKATAATTAATKTTTIVTTTSVKATTTTNAGSKPSGDLDGDNITSVSDAVLMQKYLCGFTKITKDVFAKLDINQDNKFNVFDWLILKKRILNSKI